MQYTIVTGMSGSGKTKVIRYLEDMGYFCIDNMPPMLIPKFSEMLTSVNGKFNNVAFVVDTRVGDMINELLAQIDDLKQKGYDCKLLYIYASGDTKQGLEINVMAFGFKYGMPLDADLVFDVRCFPNPFYIDELKHKTGNDKEVQDYVMSFPKSVTFMEKLEDFMEFMIPLYIEEGKISLTIAIGCTGGKHRSVTMTNKLADYLKSCDYMVNVSYRDMGRE